MTFDIFLTQRKAREDAGLSTDRQLGQTEFCTMLERIYTDREDVRDFVDASPTRISERPTSVGSVHRGVTSATCAVLSELGVNPLPLLREAGCGPWATSGGSEAITNAALGRLLQLGASRTRCGHFGLLVGRRIALAELGPSNVLIRNAGTVGAALHLLESQPWAWTCGSAVRLCVAADLALLHYFPYEPGATAVGLQSEAALATVVNIVRALCGAHWSPSELLLPRAAPDQTEPYANFFRAPVRFDQEWAVLAFPSRLLKQAIDGTDRGLHAAADYYSIRQAEPAAPLQMSEQLRRLLRAEFIQSPWSGRTVARHLAVHRRTLSRRLRAEGTSYRSVAAQIRFEMAKQLLADTNMTLAQISACLGFSEAAAFTHAFRRWSGTTPSIWRQATRSADTAEDPPLPAFATDQEDAERSVGTCILPASD